MKFLTIILLIVSGFLYGCDSVSTSQTAPASIDRYPNLISATVNINGMVLSVRKSYYDWSLVHEEVRDSVDIDTTIGYSFTWKLEQDTVSRSVDYSTRFRDSFMIETGRYQNGEGSYRVFICYNWDSQAKVLNDVRIFRGYYQRYFGSEWEREDIDLLMLQSVPVVYQSSDSIFAAAPINSLNAIEDFNYSRFDGQSNGKSYAHYNKEALLGLKSLKQDAALTLSLKFSQ